jgi:hypothetical protein
MAGGRTLGRLRGSDGMASRYGKRNKRQGERDTSGDWKLYAMEIGPP